MRRSRKILLFLAVALLIALAVGGVQAVRIDRHADLWARTGQGAIQLLKELAAGIQVGVAEANFDRALACFDDGDSWLSPAATLVDERDGIRVYSWAPGPRVGSGRDGLEASLRAYLEGVDTLESSRLKLTALEEIPSDGEAVIQSVLWLTGRWQDGDLFESQIRFRMRRQKRWHDTIGRREA